MKLVAALEERRRRAERLLEPGLMLDFADLETARAARGVRMVVSGAVASPWSEAAKGLFRLARIPVLAMRRVPGDASHVPWTESHNVPVVFHDDEPPRTVWSQIVALAARLAPSDVQLLPSEIRARATTIGLIHEIAGERGIGWNARIMMIHASLSSEGKRGFPLPVAKRLAGKYGYTPDALEPGRAHVIAALTALAEELGDKPYSCGRQTGRARRVLGDVLDAAHRNHGRRVSADASDAARCVRHSHAKSSRSTCRRRCSRSARGCSSITWRSRSRCSRSC